MVRQWYDRSICCDATSHYKRWLILGTWFLTAQKTPTFVLFLPFFGIFASIALAMHLQVRTGPNRSSKVLSFPLFLSAYNYHPRYLFLHRSLSMMRFFFFRGPTEYSHAIIEEIVKSKAAYRPHPFSKPVSTDSCIKDFKFIHHIII